MGITKNKLTGGEKMRKIFLASVVGLLLLAGLATARFGPHPAPTIYVYGGNNPGTCYQSIVTADPLPNKGPFQLLEDGGPTGLQTEFGPGDVGYVGGRWFKPGRPNEYFSCPLLYEVPCPI
jgi:hypothetical protein